MITFKRYDNEAAAIGADIALKNRLYVSGWALSGVLKAIRDKPNGHSICIAFVEGKPVSVIAKYNADSDNGATMAFTRKSMRRKGIASNLIKNTRLKVGRVEEGVSGSCSFWRKVVQQST